MKHLFIYLFIIAIIYKMYVWREQKLDSSPGPFERQSSDQENAQHHVR